MNEVRAKAQSDEFARAYGQKPEIVYCEQCGGPEKIELRRERTKAAILKCGHVVCYEEDTGTWI